MTINGDIKTQRECVLFEGERGIELLKVLGSGGFGTCYKATVNISNNISKGKHNNESNKHITFCLKKINCTSKKKAALQSFLAETKDEFYNFDHPNIVKLLAATPLPTFDNDDEVILEELLMAFEFVEGCNLKSLLENENENIDLSRMCKFGREIASALQYVHSFGIVHLDLKPANVMVTRSGVCKLADFGCSQYIESDHISTESLLTGTFAYRAPELHCGSSPTWHCDVFALGICLWQFWSRVQPFQGMSQQVVIYNVVRSNLRPSFQQNTTTSTTVNLKKQVNSQYRHLANQCWSSNTNDRPSLEEVIKTLKEIDEDK